MNTVIMNGMSMMTMTVMNTETETMTITVIEITRCTSMDTAVNTVSGARRKRAEKRVQPAKMKAIHFLFISLPA
jgi:hypothetical protein